MNTRQARQAWPFAGLLILMLLILTLLLYQHTALYLIRLWNNLDVGEYAHGYLVLAISAYLIYSLKNKLSTLTPCPEHRALILVISASMLWMISALIDIEVLQALSLLILVFAIIWSMLGNQVIRLLAFPILFIIFAIPIWFPLSSFLQNITADAVFGAIRLLSIPAFRQDNIIVLPAGSLSIEEACSGLRYLLAALTLGTLYAYMNYFSLRARLTVVLVTACSAVVANILRVFIVVYLGYTTEMQHPLVDDHLTLGWYLFAGLIVILLFVDTWLYKKQALSQTGGEPKQAEVKEESCIQNHFHYISFASITGLLVFIAPVAVYMTSIPSTITTESIAPKLPHNAEEWVQTPANSNNWIPDYHGAIHQKQTYQKNNRTVELYIGYYPTQKQGEELISDLNRIDTRSQWQTIYPRPILQNIEERQVLEQVLDNDAKKQRVVWYWYNVAGTVTTNKYEAKILQALGLLDGKTWGFVMAVATDMSDDIDFTRQVMKDFILSIQKPMENEIILISGHH
ncbi:MAG: EpsI family protein [Gammaproteobacteria bacterium]|nr:EpsI family protein [Gammaproteobacteria bacterium]